MIPQDIQQFVFLEMGAPGVIRSNEQMLAYVSALLELDGRAQLTEAEENFAELLSLLIEAYVQLQPPPRLGSEDASIDSLFKRNVWRQ